MTTRQKANQKGAITYLGSPCITCGSKIKYTAQGACVQCQANRNRSTPEYREQARVWEQNYEATPGAQAVREEYRQTPECKEIKAEYDQSEAGKTRRQKFLESTAGRRYKEREKARKREKRAEGKATR